MTLCRHCGFPLKRDDAKFCTKCGRAVTPADPPEPGGPAIPEEELPISLPAEADRLVFSDQLEEEIPAREEVPVFPAPEEEVTAQPGEEELPEAPPVSPWDDLSNGHEESALDPFPPADEEEEGYDPFPAEEEAGSFPSAGEEPLITDPFQAREEGEEEEPDLAKTLDFPVPPAKGPAQGFHRQEPAAPPPPAQPFPPRQQAPRPMGRPPQMRRPAAPPPVYTPPAPSPQQSAPAAAPVKRRRAAGPRSKLVYIVAAALLVILLAGGYFGVNARYRAQAAVLIDEFVQAIAAGNADAIQQVVQDSGGTVAVGALEPLARAGADPAAREQVREMLEGQLSGSRDREDCAIMLQTRPAMLLFRRYAISIEPVTLLLETEIADADLLSVSLSGSAATPVRVERGIALQNVYPGLYEAQSFYSAYGVTLGSEPETLTLLSRQENYTPLFDAVTATISCEHSDAVILINGYTTELKAENGVVTVYPAAAGMEVVAQAHIDNRIDTARVRIVRGTADYAFQFSQTAGDIDLSSLPAEQMDAAYTLRNYFYSYLETINLQDPQELRHCTDAQREFAAERATGDANSGYLFQFEALWLDMDTFEFYSEGGVQSARVMVSLRYRYTDRENPDNWQDSGNVQWCTLVLQDGGWLVSGTAIDNNRELSDNRLTLP